MKTTHEDRTYFIRLFRDMLQAALEENRSMKSVIAELDAVIAHRTKETGQ